MMMMRIMLFRGRRRGGGGHEGVKVLGYMAWGMKFAFRIGGI